MAAFMDAIPAINVAIVSIVAVLLSIGWHKIRRKRVSTHKRLMLTATGLFALFLALYLLRLIVEGPTRFTAVNPDAPPWAYTFYLVFLIVHMSLAVVVVGMIPVVIRRALRKDWTGHRGLARRLLPMWLVSIAMGIGVYLQLYVIW